VKGFTPRSPFTCPVQKWRAEFIGRRLMTCEDIRRTFSEYAELKDSCMLGWRQLSPEDHKVGFGACRRLDVFLTQAVFLPTSVQVCLGIVSLEMMGLEWFVNGFLRRLWKTI